MLEQKRAKADRIRSFIEQEGLGEYYEKARAQLVDAMLSCDTKDDLGRFRLQVTIKQLDKFWQYLGTMLAEGQLAERDLRDIENGKRSFF